MSAAVDGGVLTYLGFLGGGSGYYIIGGTSEATPEFSGIVAIADQAAGHDLGFLNPLLYKLGTGAANGIVDVTKGNNTVTFTQDGQTTTVKGFKATKGYDLASGLGTPDAAKLVMALAGDVALALRALERTRRGRTHDVRPLRRSGTCARTRYVPATVISPTRIVGAPRLPPNGKKRRSLPTSVTDRRTSSSVLATVISRSGRPRTPFSMARPAAPTEKSPVTELAPECSPVTSWT